MRIELVVTDDAGIGITLVKECEDLVQYDHLFSSPVVFINGLLMKGSLPKGRAGGESPPTLVADANREAVVALDMASDHFYGPAVIKRTVSTHIEMISRISAKASSTMAGDELREGEVLIGPRVGAVQDQEVNFPGRTMTVRTQQGQHLRPWQWS